MNFKATLVAALHVCGGGLSLAAEMRPSDRHASTYFVASRVKYGFTIAQIPWDKYTDVKWAHAATTPDGSLDLSNAAPELLPEFVATALKNRVIPMVSIGGWKGSRWFSTAVSTPERRTAFVKTCLDLVAKYKLGGLDFDWQFPNHRGIGCNEARPDDTSNYLAFLRELQALPEAKALRLTATGPLVPWNDATGAPSTDVSGFGEVLSAVTIIAYAVYGPWAPTAGPTAPLRQYCDSVTRNIFGGTAEGLAKWARAGLRSEKTSLGITAFGRSYWVDKKAAFIPGYKNQLDFYPPFDHSKRLRGSSWDTDPPVDVCGNPSSPSGVYQFWSMIKEASLLGMNGEPAPGIHSGYDSCGNSAVVYNETSSLWVSYDSFQSFKDKGEFIVSQLLGGFTMWEVGGDFNNMLIDTIRKPLFS